MVPVTAILPNATRGSILLTAFNGDQFSTAQLSDSNDSHVMRLRTVAEINSLTSTTAKIAISITATSFQANRLIEE